MWVPYLDPTGSTTPVESPPTSSEDLIPVPYRWQGPADYSVVVYMILPSLPSGQERAKVHTHRLHLAIPYHLKPTRKNMDFQLWFIPEYSVWSAQSIGNACSHLPLIFH